MNCFKKKISQIVQYIMQGHSKKTHKIVQRDSKIPVNL